MTSSSSILHIFSHLIGASNYASWATNIQYVLMDKDLWSIVSGLTTVPSPSLEAVDNLDTKASPEYVRWSRENDRACATIALACQDGPKGFIKNLTARQMWLKLKELYEVQGFNARYLTFTILLSHHYDSSKSIKNYIDQLKASSQRLKEMNSSFSD